MKSRKSLISIASVMMLAVSLFFVIGLTATAATPKNADMKINELRYAMEAQGMNFGNTTMTREFVQESGQKLLQEKTITYIMLSVQNTISSEEVAKFNKDEDLVSYKGSHATGPDTIRVEAEIWNNSLVVSGSTQGGELEPWIEVNRKDYDFTSLHIPMDKLKLGKKETVKRFLDFGDENFTNHKNKMKLVGKEKQTIGDFEFDCQIVAIDFGHIKGKMWIAKDKFGYFLLKEEAVSTEMGPFTMKVVDYIPDPNNSGDQSGEDFGF